MIVPLVLASLPLASGAVRGFSGAVLVIQCKGAEGGGCQYGRIAGRRERLDSMLKIKHFEFATPFVRL